MMNDERKSSVENGCGNAGIVWTPDWYWMSVGCHRDWPVSVSWLCTDCHPSRSSRTFYVRTGSLISACFVWTAPCTGWGSQPCAWMNNYCPARQSKDCPLHFSWDSPTVQRPSF